MKHHQVACFVATLALGGCHKSDATPAGAEAASAAVAQVASPDALKDFEGEVDVSITSVKEPKPIPPIDLLVKGTKLRFDVPEGMGHAPKFSGKAYVVVNTTEKKLYVVVDEQKQIILMDLANLGQQMAEWNPRGPGDAEHTPPKITKTGHTETVAGYTCEDWNVSSAKGEQARVCVSDQSTSWFQLPGINLPTEHSWAKELFDGRHLPLRMIGYDAAGTEENRMEVTKLEKKPVADSLFELPTGYRTMDLSGIMKSVMGGMNAAGAMPPGAPPGMQLPPGVTLPPGVQLPPGMQLPAGTAEMLKRMQAQARAGGMPPLPPAAK